MPSPGGGPRWTPLMRGEIEQCGLRATTSALDRRVSEYNTIRGSFKLINKCKCNIRPAGIRQGR